MLFFSEINSVCFVVTFKHTYFNREIASFIWRLVRCEAPRVRMSSDVATNSRLDMAACSLVTLSQEMRHQRLPPSIVAHFKHV